MNIKVEAFGFYQKISKTAQHMHFPIDKVQGVKVQNSTAKCMLYHDE